jgi:hypothetical protein
VMGPQAGTCSLDQACGEAYCCNICLPGNTCCPSGLEYSGSFEVCADIGNAICCGQGQHLVERFDVMLRRAIVREFIICGLVLCNAGGRCRPGENYQRLPF